MAIDTSNFIDASKTKLTYDEYLALKSDAKIAKEKKNWEVARKHGWPAVTVGITGA